MHPIHAMPVTLQHACADEEATEAPVEAAEPAAEEPVAAGEPCLLIANESSSSWPMPCAMPAMRKALVLYGERFGRLLKGFEVFFQDFEDLPTGVASRH